MFVRANLRQHDTLILLLLSLSSIEDPPLVSIRCWARDKNEFILPRSAVLQSPRGRALNDGVGRGGVVAEGPTVDANAKGTQTWGSVDLRTRRQSFPSIVL